MMDVLTYDELRLIEREERDNKKLVELGDDFIDRYQLYIADKQRVLDKSDDNVIAQKVKERTKTELFNARNSFKSIFEVRARKIFDQVMLDLRMGVNSDYKGLLSKERLVYDNVRKALISHFDEIVKGNLKKGNKSTEIKDDNVLVRFIKDFPEFAWNDLTLGPFTQEDVVNLPPDVVKLLANKEVIQEVHKK